VAGQVKDIILLIFSFGFDYKFDPLNFGMPARPQVSANGCSARSVTTVLPLVQWASFPALQAAWFMHMGG